METPFFTDFFLVKRGVIMNVAEKAKENKEEKKQFCFVHMFREVY